MEISGWLECLSQSEKDEGQIGGRSDGIEVAEVNDEDVGCHVGEGGEKTKLQIPNSKIFGLVFHEEIHSRASQKQMEGNEEFHCDVGEIGEQKEQKEIRRIEKSVLVIGDEGECRSRGWDSRGGIGD